MREAPFLTHMGPLAITAKGSETLALAQQAGQLKATGVEVFNFTVGEPDGPPPAPVIAAAHRAIDQGYHKYTPADGLSLLKEAIATWHHEVYGASDVAPENIVVTAGAKQAISEVLLIILKSGEEVILPRPCWVSYPTMVRIANGEPVYADADPAQGYRLSLESVRAAVSPRTAALLINSPSNPTGAVMDRETVLGLCDLAEQENIWILSDDIYGSLVYDDVDWAVPGMFPQYRDRTISIHGVSKGFAMTGWRIGWLVAPEHLAKSVGRLQSQFTSNANAVAQVAAATALTHPESKLAMLALRERLRLRRNLMVDLLNQVEGIHAERSPGAFYCFADVQGLMERSGSATDYELCQRLIKEAHVVAVPGSAFGQDGRLRFSFATDEDTIRRGMEAVARFSDSFR
ncbi:MAG: aminotransferase class I/II-fold pyridoxal phosphate-dependent enzyme [Deltaproteobacteria bacterium]|nr:aminotransferase class I/II-fold pyridoxal phosphate-dependent enzyme [Deltaproteobacteria bacterium]